MGLILWTSLCFVGLAVNNVLLFFDLVVVLNSDLRVWRDISALAGAVILLYGMIDLETS